MKILLATDGSEYSEGAARFLTHLNLTPADEVSVLHVMSWVPIMSEWASIYSDFKELQDEVVPKILDAASNVLQPVKARKSASYVEDYPDKAIVEKAVEWGSDLIVMGTRGARGIEARIVGSVTKMVAINSPKPVLIINPSQREISGNLKILFATDGSDHSDSTGKVLSAIPFPDGTEITILNVVTTVFEDIPERIALEINDRIKRIVADRREKELTGSSEIIGKAHAAIKDKFRKIEHLTKFGDPSLEILRAAEEVNADIIAVGTSGMRGIKGMLGSVSRYVLNHAGCSVLIGKA